MFFCNHLFHKTNEETPTLATSAPKTRYRKQSSLMQWYYSRLVFERYTVRISAELLPILSL